MSLAKRKLWTYLEPEFELMGVFPADMPVLFKAALEMDNSYSA